MIHLFDGATGTMLQAAGMKPGECPELYNITHPEIVLDIHRQYVEAGTTLLHTNTFGANRQKLSAYGLQDRLEEINRAAVRIAKEAAKAGQNVKVVGDLGPTGKFLAPLGELSFDEAYDIYRQQATVLEEAGVDCILIETIIDIQEMRAALLAVKDNTKLPVICQMSYSEDGRTVTGTDPETAAVILDAMGADVIGANCSCGPAQLLPVVEKLYGATTKPISIQPNAGLPRLVDGKTVFPMSPEEMGKWAPKLIAAGATYLGGCCGTTPAHIRAMADAVRDLSPIPAAVMPEAVMLTSRSKTVAVSASGAPLLIGERINPTGRKQMAADIRAGSLLSVKQEALAQAESGASILDVNMGVPGIDQADIMGKAIGELSMLTDLPLAIDTGDAAALEAGLKAYPGRALINSVSAEPDRLRDFLPLAKRYGAAILCLPISEAGIPKTAEDRLAVIETILKEAERVGIPKNSYLLDALVMTVATDANSANETLRTLRLYRAKYPYPTTMGLSNVSFGLPNRPSINANFFTMCLAAGLNAPIMNPHDAKMQEHLAASCALLGYDPCGRQYSITHSNAAAPIQTAPAASTLPTVAQLKEAVIRGEKELAESLVIKALEEGSTPSEITEQGLTEAMNVVGEKFSSDEYFLPQVLLSAETMHVAFQTIRRQLPSLTIDSLGTVVLATVKGDIHDLGKNIVAALLENSGFTVIDLGKDVAAETVVSAAKEHNADLVGLCALMTTTVTEIDHTIDALNAANISAQTIIGGAVVTEDYARSVGATAYAEDGVAAVRIAKQLLGK
ncbi:MAG: homocysteine S-methyltransferase family protein [Selenomonadales bacterium]|nr:homocysteine S-methyltransferase family protein [Selenomonadales bacterium]